MATAVLDLHLENLPLQLTGFNTYQQALILIRVAGRPAGQALLPVCQGRIGGDNLLEALLCAADSAFWERWLRQHLRCEEETPKAISLSATITVCTRDRPEDMGRCLEALMRLPDDGQEYLVIDNCPSSPATRSLVGQYPRVRYVLEPRPGLDIARNRALREAKHEILVFTDDDAVPDTNWLRTLLRNFDDPRVACVTGLTMPIELETEAQEWFQRLGGLGRGFKRMAFDGACHDPFDGWQAGAGVNMAVRRSVVACLGSFDEGLDVGTPVRGGGDTDMLRRILAGGYRIVYDPEALNWHRHRAAWRDLRRQLRGYESAGFAVWTRSLLAEREFGALQQAWKWVWREIPVLCGALLRRPGSPPIDLVIARFCGAVMGPWAYLYSRWVLYKARAAS